MKGLEWVEAQAHLKYHYFYCFFEYKASQRGWFEKVQVSYDCNNYYQPDGKETELIFEYC